MDSSEAPVNKKEVKAASDKMMSLIDNVAYVEAEILDLEEEVISSSTHTHVYHTYYDHM